MLMIIPDESVPREGPRAGPPPHSIPIEPRVTSARPDKLAEVVARTVARDILERGLGSGDPLESEQELLDRLDVSRESLREGLRLLEVAGLVTLRRGPGGGTFVATVDPANLGRFASLFYQMSGASYRELFEAYALADSLLAERAALHPDLHTRREVMSPFLAAGPVGGDLEEYVAHHAAFHTEVARLANNRVLQVTLHTVGLLVGRHYLVLVDEHRISLSEARSTRRFVEDDHIAIARAIVAGNRHRARELMEDHVHHVVGVLVADGLSPDDTVEWV